MPYASAQDIIDRYGSDTLLMLTDRDGDDQVDNLVIDQAIADATAEIDTYVAAKYSLPLAVTPSVLVRLCVDIAIYRLSATADMVTEEKRQRYEDATSLLKRIAKGEVSLGISEPVKTTNGPVHIVSQPKRFGRGRLL
ncbi:MAG: DUF1320 domain-containing protein [Oceanospirillaceae bacterium]|nr:DUF1320 domain-containing protein [Oceanospirillaceae bacterium]